MQVLQLNNKKTTTLFKNGKIFERTFPQRRKIQMTNMHLRMYSTLIVTREMQIKATRDTTMHSVEWLKFKSKIMPNIAGNVG